MKISYVYTGAVTLGLLLSFSYPAIGEQVVFEGDSFSDVYQMLGEASIEFPRGKSMLRWYDEYELVFKDNTVTSVLYNPKKAAAPAVDPQQPADGLGAQSESNGVDVVTEVLEPIETNQSAAVISTALSSLSVEAPAASISTNQL